MSEMLLFSPLTIRGIELRNRIVVPPMHQYSALKGFPTDWHLMNAGKFAAGGAGLVIVESTKVERRGCGTLGDLGIWDDKFVEPLGRLVKFIHQQDAVAGIHQMPVCRKSLDRGVLVHWRHHDAVAQLDASDRQRRKQQHLGHNLLPQKASEYLRLRSPA